MVMVTEMLEKQIKAEEARFSDEVSDLLSKALNAKPVQADAARLKKPGKWPYPPDKDVVKFLEEAMKKAWDKEKRKYDAFRTDLSLVAVKGKAPAVRAVLKYKGEWRGGKSVTLELGDTLETISKREYGLSIYAGAILEANKEFFGPGAKMLPATYGLSLPEIWVPDWVKEPKVQAPPLCKAKAEEMPLPTFSITWPAASATGVIETESVRIELTLTVSVTASLAGDSALTVSVDEKGLAASLSKSFGDLSSSYKISADSGANSDMLKFKVVNVKTPDMTFTVTTGLFTGKTKLKLETKEFTHKVPPYTVKVKAAGELEVKIEPKNEKMAQETKVKSPTEAPQPRAAPSLKDKAKKGAVEGVKIAAVTTVVVVHTAPLILATVEIGIPVAVKVGAEVIAAAISFVMGGRLIFQ